MFVANEIIDVLDRCAFDGPHLTLPEQLDRKAYLAVAKVIEAAGGKWNKRAKAHVFDGDAQAAIEPVILTGDVTHARDEFDFFPTPEVIGKRLVEMAEIEPHHDVLEPSAGGMALAKLLPGKLVCVELEQKAFGALVKAGYTTLHIDFLKMTPEMVDDETKQPRRFDRIVMNPPFSKSADIRHVTHAMQFLKPGGRLVAIMAAGVEFRQTKAYEAFRDLLYANNGVVERLPEGSFKESGTMVNTVIVTMDKPLEG